ncbi:hypothetical protein GCM10010923_21510 [Blastomonas marina]|uniref:histidine kinase n=1 Tax=Blastomonas marina TaxID=1867408 RepID=A0ABQ1FG91_9SPHN|nr:CHASE domain-containing protein [Blastomonas marina]GGA10634.1 hypothetical protein GCM10010923_21510 [Blastomonas marina]
MRDIALLAVLYFVAGLIGKSLAVPPGYATIIWPASGIALCALLARGNSLWPGIWLGSFAFNFMTGLESSVNFENVGPVVAIAASLGVGATLQAIAGLQMARRFADGFELSSLRRLAGSTLLVVILPCIIAPTIGVTTLLAAGAIDGRMALDNWVTWYFGDLLGVILIMPILLLSVRSPVDVRWRGRSLQGASSLIAISLVAVLLLTFYVWRFISVNEYDEARSNFAAMAADTEEALGHRLQIYQRALEGAAALATVDNDITPSEWRTYIDRLEISRAYPGMRGFGMFEAVAAEDLPAYRAEFAREFGNRFEVHPRVERDQHFVINRIEPLESNLAALGLDLAFEEGRREAIALSTSSRNPVLTRPIVLVQDEKQGAGFLLILPVYDAEGEPTGRWVYAALVAEELLASLTPRQGEQFALEVYHGDWPDTDKLLFATGAAGASPRFELRRSMRLAGQPVTLRWTSLAPFEQRYASSAPLLALASGLLITVLLGILLTIFLRRESHVVRKVNEATAELAERNRMLEMAEATAHIGHWQIYLEGEEIEWSDEVFRLHGLEPGSAPTLAEAFAFYHPDDRQMAEEAIDHAFATGQSCNFEARLVTADGRTLHVEVIGRVGFDRSGNAKTVFGVMMDRTDETVMRERLTETLVEARAADKAKSSFLANMSHEIRTPMNGVIGFTELALSEEKDPAQKRRLQMIADSGNAMLRLLNDLLDFAKIEAKQMAVVSEPTDLRHTLLGCQRLMEPVARAQGLPLKLEIDPSLPNMVLVDKMRFRQIVLNLVGNALKFTEEGEVKISATVSQRQSDDASRIFVTVRDTGIGIPADRLDSIFEKFTQADDTTARRYGGTGLGLPISAELAELMGGELRAESEPGSGSAFTLSLPLEESTEAIPTRSTPEPDGHCGHGIALRILVAEDNPVNQELTMAMVSRAGHDCELVRNGREAVEAVTRANNEGRPYDLVLMDMQMPEMDGLQATRAIREAGFEASRLPILAVTANAYADDMQRCEAAGMQAHLAKPLRLKDLCTAIARWSARVEPPVSGADDSIEEETDPRLRSMFEDRKAATIEAIDDILDKDRPSDAEKKKIAGLLHQIAGVAAYFGQARLGESCREHERLLLDTRDDSEGRALLETMREKLAGIPEQSASE